MPLTRDESIAAFGKAFCGILTRSAHDLGAVFVVDGGVTGSDTMLDSSFAASKSPIADALSTPLMAVECSVSLDVLIDSLRPALGRFGIAGRNLPAGRIVLEDPVDLGGCVEEGVVGWVELFSDGACEVVGVPK